MKSKDCVTVGRLCSWSWHLGRLAGMHIWGSEPRGGTRVSTNARGEHGPLPTSNDTAVKKGNVQDWYYRDAVRWKENICYIPVLWLGVKWQECILPDSWESKGKNKNLIITCKRWCKSVLLQTRGTPTLK